jgi:hypothetical protein
MIVRRAAKFQALKIAPKSPAQRVSRDVPLRRIAHLCRDIFVEPLNGKHRK